MIVATGLTRQPSLQTIYRRPPAFPHWTAGILIKGSLEYSANGCHRMVHAPHVSLIPPHLTYRLRFAGKGSCWTNGWIIFSPPPHWHRWLDLPVVLPPIRGFRLPSSKEGRLLIHTLKQGRQTLEKTSGEREALIENMLEKMLILANLAQPQATVHRHDDRIASAINLIRSDYARQWTVNQLAKEVHLSASHFSHLFRQATGTGPIRLLEEYRVEQAKALLLSTNRSVGSVARSVGYENQFHFSTRFRAVTGQSPRAFRMSPQVGPPTMHLATRPAPTRNPRWTDMTVIGQDT